MIDFLTTTVIFLLALGILVVLHEWGHYIVAKGVGIWVEKFSIGFGPKIIGFQKNGTDYRLAPIPLGGYVKLYGQDPYEEADRDEVLAQKIASDPRSFASKTYWQRMSVVLAGPVMNLLLCLFLLPLTFLIGKKELRVEKSPPVVVGVELGSVAETLDIQLGDQILTFNGEAVPTWSDLLFKSTALYGKDITLTLNRAGETLTKNFVMPTQKRDSKEYGIMGIEPHPFLLDRPEVGEVLKGSPAEKAGLMAGDYIVSLKGQPVLRWSAMVENLQKEAALSNGIIDLVVRRNEALVSLSLLANLDSQTGRWLMGIVQKFPENLFVTHRYGLSESISLGMQEFRDLNAKLFEFLSGLFTGSISAKNLGGPLEIASAASTAAKKGLGDFIYLMAFLSLQLGILNLLPIPVLDGGHATFMTLELLIRRPLPHKFRLASLYSGMAFILGLMAFVIFNDLNRFLGLSSLFASFTKWLGS